MIKQVMLAVAVAAISQAASAQSMNAQSFYQRASALQHKGMLAIFSGGEIKALMAEGKAAGQRARQQRLSAVAAHQKPRFCPPAGPVTIESSEFMARLGAIPQAERMRIDMTEATTRILTVKFPCRS